MLVWRPWRTLRYRVPKLYVVVRDDLPPGLQLAQATHAALQLSLDHHSAVADWNNHTLIILSVPRERDLLSLLHDAWTGNLVHAYFVEPDLDDEFTAVAFAPCVEADRLVAQLPLALAGVTHAGPSQDGLLQQRENQPSPRRQASLASG